MTWTPACERQQQKQVREGLRQQQRRQGPDMVMRMSGTAVLL
jgi:hypothetical protein